MAQARQMRRPTVHSGAANHQHPLAAALRRQVELPPLSRQISQEPAPRGNAHASDPATAWCPATDQPAPVLGAARPAGTVAALVTACLQW